MIDIFEYTDFRKYLADCYEEKKASNPGYSYKVIADKAGFSDKSCIYSVIKGKRPLSRSGAAKISSYLKHSKHEAEYFENLVAFNQAKSLKEKNQLFEKFNKIKKWGKGHNKAQLVRKDQYDFYSRWYHSAVRSLIDMYEFKDDYKWLSKMATPPITVKQAKQSVELLKKLGMIVKQKNGTYKVSDKSITTGKEVIGLGVKNFHMECADLAKNAIQEMQGQKRHITGLTLGISKETYDTICDEIMSFQERIMQIADSDEKADRVFQLNFQMFPFSKTDNERKKS